MSGAKWIPAELPPRSFWRPWLRVAPKGPWLQWRRKKTANRTNFIRAAEPAFVLVASFDDAQTIGKALADLEDAAFPAEDVACFCSTRFESAGFWARLRAWWNAWFGSRDDGDDESILSETSDSRVQHLLASGGGLIVIRTGPRLHQACAVIENAGGRLGIG